MTSLAIRDQVNDHLLTPKNAALVIIDYQPVQVNSIMSMDRGLMVDNVVRVTKLAKTYGLPIVVTTVNVTTGLNQPMIPQLQAVLPGVKTFDRTTINAWEDVAVHTAIKATGRKKLIMVALWTEACLIFPALDALREGYEVYPVVDAVGGTSVEAHQIALERMVQAGTQPVSWVMLACELQRDWNRETTAKPFAEIVFDPKLAFVASAHPELVKS